MYKMEKENITKQEEFDISMPTSIVIGDPSYFEQNIGQHLTYVKRFRGRNDWLGKLFIREKKYEFEWETFYNIEAHIILAPDKTFLELYSNNQHYTRQKIKEHELGVDTAEYIVEINNENFINIDTGSDGYIGQVNEFYTGSKLEGITIDLIGLGMKDFELFKQEFKYVFNAKK